MKKLYNQLKVFLFISALAFASAGHSQEQSIVREWSNQLLGAITRDFARPPIHARNLFQISAVKYDAWAAYQPGAETFLLGKTLGNFTCPFDGVPQPDDIIAAQEEAISFAAYRMITSRFMNSPGVFTTMVNINALMQSRGYNINNTSTDYVNGGPAELGNYIAQQMMLFGMQDGSNQIGNYGNTYYQPINPTVEVQLPGNPNVVDPNRWQTITLTNFIDQAGNPISGTPPFLGAEWGNVVPFAMNEDDKSTFERNGNQYYVYHDPGQPTQLDINDPSGLDSFFKWNFLMVAIWQSHLDENDPTLWDVSPASIGNISPDDLPTTFQEYQQFYNYFEGNVVSSGHAANPVTGLPYEPQVVKRGDYARILAEFWADGPASETPPGHWFSIMHDVMDHPLFERRWMGQGNILSNLEYDVKAHFTMGGAMHDAAITAWGIKGWYDYTRPVMAIRYMGDQGQCSDNQLPNYSPAGLPLIPGYVEQVQPGDPLAGDNNEHVNKIKLYTWKGPYEIGDPEFESAGVDWILCENWWPYQRPTFVTPPFAGYVSGHSTYSRTAAEVMTLITGDPFFPGGMSNYVCPAGEFLEFENGPSEDVILQWATYRDASDQCSLSRIWGGIHPPIDDIPGRFLGMILGPESVDYANEHFNSPRPQVELANASQSIINISDIGENFTYSISFDRVMNTAVNPDLEFLMDNPVSSGAIAQISSEWVDEFTFEVTYEVLVSELQLTNIKVKIEHAEDENGYVQQVFLSANPYLIDTDRPEIVSVLPQSTLINDQLASAGQYTVAVNFNEACDTGVFPIVELNSASDLSSTLIFNPGASSWASANQFIAAFNLTDNEDEFGDISVQVSGTQDAAGNGQEQYESNPIIGIDTRNPLIDDITVSDAVLIQQDAGSMALVITLEFDEEMNTTLSPQFSFVNDNPLGTSLFLNSTNSLWLNSTTYQRAYNLINWDEEFFNINIQLQNMKDLAGNNPGTSLLQQLFIIDTKRPNVSSLEPSVSLVSDSEVGTAAFQIEINYNEPMDMNQNPVVQLTSISPPIGNSLVVNMSAGSWLNNMVYSAVFNVNDENKEIDQIGVTTSFAKDAAGNNQFTYNPINVFALDTKNPELLLMNANTYLVDNSDIGALGFEIVSVFSEEMLPESSVELAFSQDVSSVLTLNAQESGWLNSATYKSAFDVANTTANISDIDVLLENATDLAGNTVSTITFSDYFSINISIVGVTELDAFDVKLYPNPLLSGQALTLSLGETIQNLNLMMLDAQGKTIMRKEMSNVNAGNHSIAVPKVSSGLYFINLQIDGAQATYKMLIQD
jgi:hypothetical protein